MAVLLDRPHDLKDLSHGLTVSSAFSGFWLTWHSDVPALHFLHLHSLHRVNTRRHIDCYVLAACGSKILMDPCSHNLFASKFNNQFHQNIILPLVFSIDYIKLWSLFTLLSERFPIDRSYSPPALSHSTQRCHNHPHSSATSPQRL